MTQFIAGIAFVAFLIFLGVTMLNVLAKMAGDPDPVEWKYPVGAAAMLALSIALFLS